MEMKIASRYTKQKFNLLVGLSLSFAFNLKGVSIDRALHLNLVGHLFSDYTLLN